MKKKLISALEKLFAQANYDFTKEIQLDLPRKWEKHGDLVLLPENCFTLEIWRKIDPETLWKCVAQSLQAHRVAKQAAIVNNDFRSPNVVMLYGKDTSVIHIDNKIKYQFDVTKCMFSSGNITEKIRLSKLNCQDDVVVDMFAGIGYFTLPFLVHAKAKYLHACEWNPDAVKALHKNLILNKVADRCTIHEGDNRKVCPINIADRVNLGLIPSSSDSFLPACNALKRDTGGILHVHGNVSSFNNDNLLTDSGNNTFIDSSKVTCNRTLKGQWLSWSMKTAHNILQILLKGHEHSEENNPVWSVAITHIARVKQYAPHIDHIVVDLECRPVCF